MRRFALLAGIVGLVSGSALAEPAAPGATLAPFALPDQHGTPRTIDASVRALVLTRDMDGGAIVREALGDGGAERLSRAGALYVSDVSGMPGIIRATIAEPRLRQRPYPVLLDREGDATKALPSASDRPVVIVLEELRIVRVEEPGNPAALLATLDALAAAPVAE